MDRWFLLIILMEDVMEIIKKWLKKKYFLLFLSLFIFQAYNGYSAEENNKYVGTAACADCHSEIVEIFQEKSPKAKSERSILIMREKLTEREFQNCLSCHSTGYGKPGGFVSFEATPHLANVGCEACHGMGYLHTIEADPEKIIRTPTEENCITCHDDSKVTRINYDGRIHAGAH